MAVGGGVGWSRRTQKVPPSMAGLSFVWALRALVPNCAHEARPFPGLKAEPGPHDVVQPCRDVHAFRDKIRGACAGRDVTYDVRHDGRLCCIVADVTMVKCSRVNGSKNIKDGPFYDLGTDDILDAWNSCCPR